MSVATDALSVRLRSETREIHEAVENTAAFNRRIVIRLPERDSLAGADLARLDAARAQYTAVYREFLIASHGFENAVDDAVAHSPVLDAALAAGYSRSENDAAARIRVDLAAVFGAAAVASLPHMTPLAPPASLAELVGMEYVRTGSRAGGAVIGAVVQRNLALTREHGASFLLWHGKATKGVITAFKDWADGLNLDATQQDAAVAAAIRTFEAVQRWHFELEKRSASSPPPTS